jgi:hypothetical protein
MTHSRRDFGACALSLFATGKAVAQGQSPTLKSEMYRFEDRAVPMPRSFAHPIWSRLSVSLTSLARTSITPPSWFSSK